MWGQIFVDYSMHRNFNVGFTTHKNDVHIHLSQWQYWWWFWFALVWSLYFLIIIKSVASKVENYNIVLNTSLRSHGKWGDFLVALVPLSWCGNILINSNFILRMLEWQNEASLFTVRIQGKQWYWVYKYNSDTAYRLQNVFINVGNNNWYKSVSSSNTYFNYQNSTLNFVYEYEFKKLYKQNLDKALKLPEHLYSWKFNTHFNKFNYILPIKIKLQNINSVFINYKLLDDSSIHFNLKTIDFKALIETILNVSKIYEMYHEFVFTKDFYSNFLINSNYRDKASIFYSFENTETLTSYESNRLEEVEDTDKNLRLKMFNFPIKLTKGILNKHNISLISNNNNLNKNILFSYRINDSDVTSKVYQIEQFWGFRQKKYKKLRSFVFSQNHKYSNRTYKYIENFVNNENFNKYNLYTSIKNNKYKNELIPTTLAKRLLRTKRTLILPAHINITLITSSYDVVHSWFVPGLGLKIDCVPGRSTHHTLYIDNIGFYYGQCAEICGRYHHHMPIRVCALSYEHFLLWWQTKGLPRMYRSKEFAQNRSLLLTKFKY